MTITINGRTLSERDINIESAHHPAADPRVSQHRAAVALVIRELLLDRAREKQATDSALRTVEDDEAAIAQLLEQELDLPSADEETCRQYYLKNPERFRSPDLFEVRHILLAAAPDDLEGREQAREAAEVLIEQLERRPELFTELARAHSACPSKEQGGNLGQISKGQTVPEFEQALSRLSEGLATTPIETRYGFHVIELAQKIDGKALPFALVHDRIAHYLEQQAHRRALSQYLQILIARASIQGIEITGADSLLVQ